MASRPQKQLVREDRHRADAEFLNGVAASEQGDIREAERCYLVAIAYQKDHAEALVNLAQCLAHRRQFLQAEKYLRKAIAVDPNYALAWCNLGVALERRDCKREAVGAYRAAVLICPQYVDAQYALALLYSDLGELSLARDYAVRFIQSASHMKDQQQWFGYARVIIRRAGPSLVPRKASMARALREFRLLKVLEGSTA